MNIFINGESQQIKSPLTLGQLLEQLQLHEQRIAVEVNQKLISRTQHAALQLNAADRIEIVHAIGGG